MGALPHHPIAAAALLLLSASMCPADALLADFEGESYGDWIAEGQAFGDGPARGTLPHQMEVSGFRGHGLVSSFVGGDGSRGRLLSPLFVIDAPWISFLVGGGYKPGEAEVR
ncbi:MAG: glycoside hydrolase family 32 protein, partial [Armatimonadia bacterium]|nr:glycoside hydrolase family 32 protein [Armatimonadia bacterium]